jgi:hypothetical protein
MRDGIPRSLPVPRKWQRVIESADRAADRGTERVVLRVCDALQDDFRREFPDDERKRLVRLAAEPLELFSPLAHGGVLDDAASSRISPAMQKVLASARSHHEDGLSERDAVQRALVEHAEECVSVRRRQIREDLAGKVEPKDVNKVMSEYDRAASAADLHGEVSKFLRDSSAPPASKATKITPDEDLRGRTR